MDLKRLTQKKAGLHNCNPIALVTNGYLRRTSAYAHRHWICANETHNLLHTKPHFLAQTIYFLSLWWKRREDNLTEKQKEGGTKRKKGVAADSGKNCVLLVVLGCTAYGWYRSKICKDWIRLINMYVCTNLSSTPVIVFSCMHSFSYACAF